MAIQFPLDLAFSRLQCASGQTCRQVIRRLAKGGVGEARGQFYRPVLHHAIRRDDDDQCAIDAETDELNLFDGAVTFRRDHQRSAVRQAGQHGGGFCQHFFKITAIHGASGLDVRAFAFRQVAKLKDTVHKKP